MDNSGRSRIPKSSRSPFFSLDGQQRTKQDSAAHPERPLGLRSGFLLPPGEVVGGHDGDHLLLRLPLPLWIRHGDVANRAISMEQW
jgi:hypothetical protein